MVHGELGQASIANPMPAIGGCTDPYSPVVN